MTEETTLQFAYVSDPVRPEIVTNPDAWTPEDVRVGEAHFAYLEAARHFMQSDPLVATGLMRASLHPFRAALVRGETS